MPAVDVSADPNAATASFTRGNGLEIKSPDGKFSLTAGLRAQILDELHEPAASGSPPRNYTLLRQARLIFSGNAFSKDIKYRLELGLSTPEMGSEAASIVDRNAAVLLATRNGAAASLITDRDVISQGPILDAFVDFTQLRDANLHVGQGKVPFSLEALFGDGSLQGADRSIANAEFGFDRDIGVDLRSTDFLGLDMFRYYVGVYSGEGRNATLKSVGGGDLGFTYLGRFEVFPMGTFDNHVSSDLERSSAPKLALGMAYAMAQMDATSPAARPLLSRVLGSPTDTAFVDFNTHNFTADALFRMHGFSAMTAFHYRKVTTIPLPRSGLGWTLQTGYVLSKETPLEIAATFTMVRPTDKASSSIDQFNELGGGLNYYFYGQGLKVQAEYTHLWLQGKSNTDDNRIRIQLQAAL